MTCEFEMADMGLMSYFLGLEVTQSEEGIFVCQQKYTKDILERFKMATCKPIRTPMEERLNDWGGDVGERKSTYGYAFSLGNGAFSWSSKKQQVVAFSLWDSLIVIGELVGFTNSDWGGDVGERKSTYGYAFSLGNGAFSWSSKKQQVVAFSLWDSLIVIGEVMLEKERVLMVMLSPWGMEPFHDPRRSSRWWLYPQLRRST
ncbi:hypothetical protein CRG98_007625 [Punica granatum]|uniref:Reverse transcriptase Ty1/copia-type domain-containing protein n=1 Tax=Punica granatum TaxID=22663 RepID=A0A2I0KU63_PUNGR|nr:hypothetical protein CRG98_007625 [Punica granatum]